MSQLGRARKSHRQQIIIKKNAVYNPNKCTNGTKFNPGMRFGSMDEFRKAVRDHGISERRVILFNHNEVAGVK